MVPPKLRVGLSGLGRMGKRHALHFLNSTPRAELVAISTPDDAEIDWAKQHLEPFGVTLYKSYEDMLAQDGLQAVVIASITSVHADQAIKAMAADKHVLCEKPLSTSVEVVSLPHFNSIIHHPPLLFLSEKGLGAYISCSPNRSSTPPPVVPI